MSADRPPYRVRIAHTRRGHGRMSTACAYRLDGCRDADCCCSCHGSKDKTAPTSEEQR